MSVLRRQRLNNHIEIDTEGSWAISYGDMITLLLTFFILFFSTDKDRDRMNSMSSSLIAKLDSKRTKDVVQNQFTGHDASIDQEVKDRLKANVHKVGQKLIVEFPETSFFDLGKVDLSPKGHESLRNFVKIYMPYSGNYILGIRAFTDNKRVRHRARFKDNIELSALRSVAAMRALQKYGIPLNRMRVGGFGELRLPKEELQRAISSTPNYERNGLAKARKIVIVIEPEPKETL